MPVFYECQRCTACCRWPGEVRLTDLEISTLALHFGQSESNFIQQFTRLTRDRQGLALEEKSDGSCVFLNGSDCVVQAVKPQQCRDFPNLWNFPGFENFCRAIPRVVDQAEFETKVKGATLRTTLPIRTPGPDSRDTHEPRLADADSRL